MTEHVGSGELPPLPELWSTKYLLATNERYVTNTPGYSKSDVLAYAKEYACAALAAKPVSDAQDGREAEPPDPHLIAGQEKK